MRNPIHATIQVSSPQVHQRNIRSDIVNLHSGVNALGYYLPTLLQQSVGLGEQQARLLTGVNGTIYLGAAFCCLLIIDRFGRRK